MLLGSTIDARFPERAEPHMLPTKQNSRFERAEINHKKTQMSLVISSIRYNESELIQSRFETVGTSFSTEPYD